MDSSKILQGYQKISNLTDIIGKKSQTNTMLKPSYVTTSRYSFVDQIIIMKVILFQSLDIRLLLSELYTT